MKDKAKDGPTIYLVREKETRPDGCTIYEILGTVEDDDQTPGEIQR